MDSSAYFSSNFLLAINVTASVPHVHGAGIFLQAVGIMSFSFHKCPQ